MQPARLLEPCIPVENALPYEAVYFELPDDETDWASRTGTDVIITCKVGVMQEPGRTISLLLNDGIWEVVNEGY